MNRMKMLVFCGLCAGMFLGCPFEVDLDHFRVHVYVHFGKPKPYAKTMPKLGPVFGEEKRLPWGG